MRLVEHNQAILAEVKARPCDSSISNSVLNVIDQLEARLHHIQLCYDAVKVGGQSMFKVWPGDKTGVETRSGNEYQSNQDASSYKDEILIIYPRVDVDLARNLIIAYK